MSNKEWYKDTFNSMRMSEETIRKVKGIVEKKEKKCMRAGFRVAITMAALAVVFAVGNAAVYAATGSTLVEKGMEQVSLFIDKKQVAADDIKKYKDKDGNTCYRIEVGDSEKDRSEIEWKANEKNMEDEKISSIVELDKDEVTMLLISRELKKKGEKTYLVVGDGKREIDITKDFADGDAKGTFKFEGQTLKYHVSGTVEKNTINIGK